MPPNKIVPKLANKGIYIASESSFYRILKAENQLQHRQKSKPVRQVKKPKTLTATAPNQVYSWDITYLPTQVRGVFLYLYLVMDIYNRKIVGWQVHETESSAQAAELGSRGWFICIILIFMELVYCSAVEHIYPTGE